MDSKHLDSRLSALATIDERCRWLNHTVYELESIANKVDTFYHYEVSLESCYETV